MKEKTEGKRRKHNVEKEMRRCREVKNREKLRNIITLITIENEK